MDFIHPHVNKEQDLKPWVNCIKKKSTNWVSGRIQWTPTPTKKSCIIVCLDVQDDVESNLNNSEGGSKLINNQEVSRIWVHSMKKNDRQPQICTGVPPFLFFSYEIGSFHFIEWKSMCVSHFSPICNFLDYGSWTLQWWNKVFLRRLFDLFYVMFWQNMSKIAASRASKNETMCFPN